LDRSDPLDKRGSEADRNPLGPTLRKAADAANLRAIICDTGEA
jgi:hypothetical protein